MNKNQKEKLRIAIEHSRARLMKKAPPFALMLMYVRFVAVLGMDRISTNGNCIFFEPTYLNKLDPEELDFILCHQIMHILYEDIWRSDADAYANYHYACDLRINSALIDNGIFDSYSIKHKYQHRLPGNYDAVPSKMSIKDILAFMVFNLDSFDNSIKKKYISDSDFYWGRSPHAFASILILDRESSDYVSTFSDQMLEADPNSKGDWQERAGMVWNAALSNKKRDNADDGDGEDGDATGTAAALMERIVKKLREPKIDWKKILNDFITEQTSDYSFSPPDRRFDETGFFLPDFNEKDYICKELLFMVDTSSSVDDKALAIVYSEIKGALEQHGGRLDGKLGFFDSRSTVPVEMCSVEDLLSIVPKGGGGTDFHAIFDSIQGKDDLPACIIAFTDGEGLFPSQSIARGVPVMWIINNEWAKPPWGKVIRLLPNELRTKR